ncbi:MAG: hypothetical protein OES99_09540, partial [Gammaproteobacteria bacterium]|nr:hypothetical protein [Gammaproteobacteria bacterium]
IARSRSGRLRWSPKVRFSATPQSDAANKTANYDAGYIWLDGLIIMSRVTASAAPYLCPTSPKFWFMFSAN